MTCCFIGHRRIKHKKELASRLRDNICYLLEQGVATFLFGDHSEFNALCYEVVSELREVYPKIRRIHYRTDYPDADAYTMQYLLDGYEDSICPDGVAAAGKAAYARFPEWYFCPKCRRFQPISDWVSDYRKSATQKRRDSDPDMLSLQTKGQI